MDKCVLEVFVPKAKEACGTDNMCVGMEARIEGGIHQMSFIQKNNYQEEDWFSLLIDTQNAKNEENPIVMLCSDWYEWPSGA